MIEQRFAAFGDKKKIFYISTPELALHSNINAVYEKGDQRKFHMPCPCCAVEIVLEWETFVTSSNGTVRAGITWATDDNGKLIDSSVGYICQECGEFFNESHKTWMLTKGTFRPTAEPIRKGYYSFHVSSLYAPAGMYNWTYYVRIFLEAERATENKTALQQAFQNLVLGRPFTPTADELKANDLMGSNIRRYPIGVVPEQQSIADGNGKILLITCGADMNGTENDARLDFEVVGWSETGASYSILHGSIGTFVPRENKLKNKVEREKWTYKTSGERSVWEEFQKILTADYFPEDGKRKYKILMSGIDRRHYTNYADAFLDKYNTQFRVGIMGVDEDKVFKYGQDVAKFRAAKDRGRVYLLHVNSIKDDLAEYMKLKWDPMADDRQPEGFMNFPSPSENLYLYNNFFSHFEAEQKLTELKDGQGIGTRWVKKNSAVQNHMWDCRVYNIALRDIFVSLVFKALQKELKHIKNPTWADYVALLRK
jgi:phage terminase large subunit GpA-like protein